jgi:hypothetical protein
MRLHHGADVVPAEILDLQFGGDWLLRHSAIRDAVEEIMDRK